MMIFSAFHFLNFFLILFSFLNLCKNCRNQWTVYDRSLNRSLPLYSPECQHLARRENEREGYRSRFERNPKVLAHNKLSKTSVLLVAPLGHRAHGTFWSGDAPWTCKINSGDQTRFALTLELDVHFSSAYFAFRTHLDTSDTLDRSSNDRASPGIDKAIRCIVNSVHTLQWTAESDEQLGNFIEGNINKQHIKKVDWSLRKALQLKMAHSLSSISLLQISYFNKI